MAHSSQTRPAKRLRHPDPLVEFFINVDPEPVLILEGMRALVEPGNLKGQALLLLQAASLGLRSNEEAIVALEAAYDQKSHIDLHILLLLNWGRLLLYEDTQGAPTIAVANQIASSISQQTPIEIRTWAVLHEAEVKLQVGDVVAYERLIAQFPGEVPPSSPHYRRFKLLQAIDHYEIGKGAAIDENALREFEAGAGPLYQKRLAMMRLVNSALVGSLGQAEALGPEVVQHASIGRAFRFKSFEVARNVVRLMAECAGRATAIDPVAPEPYWVLATRALLAQDRQGALHWARQHAAQPPGAETITNFDAYTLVRAELACRHAEAALGLLQARHERGTVHYFDDLFLARAHLLLGHRDKAAEHFARLRQAVQVYGAEGRLDFERKLAPELAAIDLINLTADSVRAQASGSTAPATLHEEHRRGADRLLSSAREMLAVKEQIARFADVDVPCLVTGETGTGKELVARALHQASARRNQPFVEINCGALSDTLIESELFGHKRGAFTGAHTAHPGLFREAGGGTIFLDEIGEISPRLQVALLRVLETGEARAVGASDTYKIGCRIVAATNADLRQRVEEKRFRADLMYRLERLQIQLPPLRERCEDVVMLAEHFLNLRRPEGKAAILLPRLKARLSEYLWPGNVRELRNVIERMRILNSDKLHYDVDDLAFFTFRAASAEAVATTAPADGLQGEAPPLRVAKPATVPEIGPGEEIASYLDNANSAFRRLRRLRALFDEFPELRVAEVVTILGVTRATATRYLETLCAEGAVRKVYPKASVRSHYYVRNTGPKA